MRSEISSTGVSSRGVGSLDVNVQNKLKDDDVLLSPPRQATIISIYDACVLYVIYYVMDYLLFDYCAYYTQPPFPFLATRAVGVFII